MMPPADPTDAVLAALGQSGLLDPARLTELTTWVAQYRPDPQTLAKELTRRGWLTSYQVKVLYKGRARELYLGPYILLDLIGEGGMGRVFKARHTRLGRDEALKVIRKEKLSNPVAVTRFQQEIRAAGQLSHPNVVVAFDSDQVDGNFFFSMEYVEGTDLTKWVRDRGPMPIAQACDAIRQAALGLQHAFEKGLVHRDIKPSNMLITPRGQVKLLDLGLAMLNEPNLVGGENANRLTQEGYVLGTPDFLAPEQAQNPAGVDIRADIYGLGATLFYLVSAKVPFDGKTPTEKLLKHITDPPPSLTAVRNDVPPALDDLVKWMMAKKADDRPQTPAQVAQSLLPFCPPSSGTAQNPIAGATYATPAAPYVQPAASPNPPPAAPFATPAATPYALPAAAPYATPAVPYVLPAMSAFPPSMTPAITDAEAFGSFEVHDDNDDDDRDARGNKTKKKKKSASADGTKLVKTKAPKQRSNLILILIGGGVVVILGLSIVASLAYTYGNRAIQDARSLEDEFVNTAGMKMMLVRNGSFQMGSNEKDSDEGPVNEVTLSKDYYMAATEVTRGQMVDVTGKAEFNMKIGYSDRIRNIVPMDRVRYNDALEFCKKLNLKDSKSKNSRSDWEYRLPTEAEWEYACRAGTTTPFSFGDRLVFRLQAVYDLSQDDPFSELPHDWKGEKKKSTPYPCFMSKEQAEKVNFLDRYREPNAWGLYDMHGNVAEWCQDYYEASYPDFARVDPTGPPSGTYRVVRGGSWQEAARKARSAARAGMDPLSTEDNIGFRVVYARKPEKK